MSTMQRITPAILANALEAALWNLHSEDAIPDGYLVQCESFGHGFNVLWAADDGQRTTLTVTVTGRAASLEGVA